MEDLPHFLVGFSDGDVVKSRAAEIFRALLTFLEVNHAIVLKVVLVANKNCRDVVTGITQNARTRSPRSFAVVDEEFEAGAFIKATSVCD